MEWYIYLESSTWSTGMLGNGWETLIHFDEYLEYFKFIIHTVGKDENGYVWSGRRSGICPTQRAQNSHLGGVYNTNTAE